MYIVPLSRVPESDLENSPADDGGTLPAGATDAPEPASPLHPPACPGSGQLVQLPLLRLMYPRTRRLRHLFFLVEFPAFGCVRSGCRLVLTPDPRQHRHPIALVADSTDPLCCHILKSRPAPGSLRAVGLLCC